MTRPRVLLSARDPGGAAQVAVLAPALRADGRVDVTVVGSGAGQAALTVAGQAPLEFTLPDGATHVSPGADTAPLLRAVRALVGRLDPDAIVTGISSLGVGLDEGLLVCAEDRPTFALQDYPGDANAIDGRFARLYFVRDAAAAELTRRRFGVPTRAIGSLRHAAYAHLDVTRLRDETRRLAGARADAAVIGFFGQPAEIPGHEKAFEHLVQALAARRATTTVVLREHPKAMDRRRAHAGMLSAAGVRVHDASGAGAAEPWLAACDVVTTCFSNSALDFAYLSAWSPAPLGATLFLLTSPELRRFLREYAGVDLPDGAGEDLGAVATTPGEVGEGLDALLRDEARRRYHAAARRLPRDADIGGIVTEVIEAAHAHHAGVRW